MRGGRDGRWGGGGLKEGGEGGDERRQSSPISHAPFPLPPSHLLAILFAHSSLSILVFSFQFGLGGIRDDAGADSGLPS